MNESSYVLQAPEMFKIGPGIKNTRIPDEGIRDSYSLPNDGSKLFFHFSSPCPTYFISCVALCLPLGLILKIGLALFCMIQTGRLGRIFPSLV
jgi:hypothetical protein